MVQRGFVRKRGSTWTAYWLLTIGDQRRQRSKGGFATKRQAQAYLNETLAALQKGDFTEPNRVTVCEYLLERWLPAKKASLRTSTWDSYRRNIELHIVPELGRIPLQQLTADRLDRFYADMLAGGHRAGGGLSPKTVRHLHTTLHKALQDALRKNLVVRNVADAADPPRLRQAGSHELRTWTPDELRVFLRGMAGHRLYAAWVLATTTGMRRGEILGLRWSDINVAARRLAVRQTVLSVGYEITFGTPKTARGRRTIALDTTTMKELAEHRARQAEEKRLVGSAYQDHGLVFAREDGRPIHPDYFSQSFDRAVIRLGLLKIRLHDLRHTHATLGLAAGIPAKLMSERLGHSTVAFTQDVYMHAIPRMEEAAADQLADLIFNEAPDGH